MIMDRFRKANRVRACMRACRRYMRVKCDTGTDTRGSYQHTTWWRYRSVGVLETLVSEVREQRRVTDDLSNTRIRERKVRGDRWYFSFPRLSSPTLREIAQQSFQDRSKISRHRDFRLIGIYISVYNCRISRCLRRQLSRGGNFCSQVRRANHGNRESNSLASRFQLSRRKIEDIRVDREAPCYAIDGRVVI